MSFNLPPGVSLGDVDPPERCAECGSTKVVRHREVTDGTILGDLAYCADCWRSEWDEDKASEDE